MNDATRANRAEAFFSAAEGLVVQLAGRWSDEYKYEDINDYKKVLDKFAAKHGIVIVRMLPHHKSNTGFPYFTFTFRVKYASSNLYCIQVKGTQYKYWRVF